MLDMDSGSGDLGKIGQSFEEDECIPGLRVEFDPSAL
jgi:hypothetical protein